MKLSIIISNRNDLTMLSVTVRSSIEALKPLGLSNCEIVIADNSDLATYNMLNSVLPTGYIQDGLLKIVRQEKPCLFTARELAASNASGQYILCLDSHMLVGHNMFLDLFNFMERHSDDPTLGFAHAPISWAHQHERAAKHDRDMSKHELGSWNSKYGKERTITWKGMPWICRREWFLDKQAGLGGYGALAQHSLSWGGGDLHIGVKPWLLGFKNWAVPCNPGIHIGPFPKIDTVKGEKNSAIVGPDKYRLYSASGVGPHAIGFLVSCFVLGGEPMMERNREAIQNRFGRYINLDKEWEQAKLYGRDERNWLNKHAVISFKSLLRIKPWEAPYG